MSTAAEVQTSREMEFFVVRDGAVGFTTKLQHHRWGTAASETTNASHPANELLRMKLSIRGKSKSICLIVAVLHQFRELLSATVDASWTLARKQAFEFKDFIMELHTPDDSTSFETFLVALTQFSAALIDTAMNDRVSLTEALL